MVYSLRQPRQLDNKLLKSKRVNSPHLLNFRYRDYSCYRDKVNRAAGQRVAGSVFCSPFIKFTLTRNLLIVYRDSYVREFYSDRTTSYRLPGLAKNSPALTQTATNHTGWPLCGIAPAAVTGSHFENLS